MYYLVLLPGLVSAGVLTGHKDPVNAVEARAAAAVNEPTGDLVDPLPQPLGDSTGRSEYDVIDAAHYAPNEIYQSVDKDDCHWVEKLVYKDQCESYTEKTCFTQQRENCQDVYQKNCTAVIDQFEERECFKVTELMCSLEERVDYTTVEEEYTVQRCTTVMDRVCDTVYDLAISSRDDYQCVDVETPNCWDEDKVIKDRTCVYSVDFDCGKRVKKDGLNSVSCEKVPTKKCYDTPRKIHEEVCRPRVSKWCDKFTNESPQPVEKQNCHSEPMKKCTLEKRTRPKKAKVYSYVEQCKPVLREVCDDVEKKKLRPVCDKVQINVCSYTPVEKCEEEVKKYCFQAENMLKEKVCVPNRVEEVDQTLRYV